MSWCPVCKNEYKEGIKVCVDCGVDLVESLGPEESVFIFGGEDALIERLSEYLKYNDIPCVIRKSDREEAHSSLFVLPKYEEVAKRAARIFLVEEQAQGETEPDPEEVGAEEAQEEEKEHFRSRQSTSIYKNRQEKAEEFKSSGIVLLLVGIVGIACMVLIDLGILPLKLNNLVMMNIMMNALFLFFIVFGIFSLKGAKKYAGEAIEEKNLTKEIKAWAEENISAEEIDRKSGCQKESDGEEILYFKRYDLLKKKVSEKFVNLDEDYLDSLIENIYQKLYEEKDAAEEV